MYVTALTRLTWPSLWLCAAYLASPWVVAETGIITDSGGAQDAGCAALLEPGHPHGPDYRTLGQLRADLAAGSESVALRVSQTERRIRLIDQQCFDLGAVLHSNPDIGELAQAQDVALGSARSTLDLQPLFGVPLLLKGNIDTGDRLPTDAGSLALAGRLAPDDAAIVARLRKAGALVVGKANLSEWANFRSERSVSGWSGVGGQTRNPHALDRNPCGSSSGSAVAVAAGLVPVAIGTETDGSIVCPAGVNGVVGYKPTHGRVSIDGIVPIAHSQDIAGPLARSVRDAAQVAAVLLDGPDDLLGALHPGALQGQRVAVWRGHFGADSDPRLAAILARAVKALRRAGASVIDPLEFELPEAISEASFAVLLHEFKADLGRYFSAGSRNRPPLSLAAVIEFNRANAARSMPWFGQDLLELTQAQGTLSQRDYQRALASGRDRLRHQLRARYDDLELDAVIALTNAPAWPIDVISGDRFTLGSSSLAAISGRPAVSVPAGVVHGLPVGVSLIGARGEDAALLAMAFALESRLPKAPRPTFRTSVTPSAQALGRTPASSGPSGPAHQ